MKTPKNKKGGAAIAAGGFGCVFNPPLQCSNGNIVDGTYVSKLMANKYAKDEILEIDKVKRVIAPLRPETRKYFLIDDSFVCKPANMTKYDLIGFNAKCQGAIGVRSEDINNPVNKKKLSILQMKNGGGTVHEYIMSLLSSINIAAFHAKFVELNNLMIGLLENGIVPLNQVDYNHFDIKSDNILINTTTDPPELSIIDWGLSAENTKKKVSKTASPMVYNLPYSLILLGPNAPAYIKTMYNQFKIANPNNTVRDRLTVANEVAKGIVNAAISPSRYLAIARLIIQSQSEYEVNRVIREYVAVVLFEYVNFKTGAFNSLKYSNDVFSKNADVWGFLSIYTYLRYVVKELIVIDARFAELSKLDEGITDIIQEYLIGYKYATKPIDIQELIHKLRNLNTINAAVVVKQPKIRIRIPKGVRKTSNKVVIVHSNTPIAKIVKRCPNGTRKNKKALIPPCVPK